MISKDVAHSTNKSILINRILYGAFVGLGFYHLLVRRDVGDAMSNLGIAILFDPFDQRVRWDDRPRYQRIWLLVHVVVVITVLGVLIYKSV